MLIQPGDAGVEIASNVRQPYCYGLFNNALIFFVENLTNKRINAYREFCIDVSYIFLKCCNELIILGN